jgi:DnaJ-like protein
MFERNRVDNAPEMNAVPVEITCLDGTLLKGRLLVPIPKSLADALNGGTAFIEFEPYGGERRYLNKAQLAAVKPLGVPKVPGLQTRLRQSEDFDPYAVLGVTPATSRDEIREAYVALAKCYHPDRYANVVLPPEVSDYLAAMARRINVAHAALELPEKRRAMRQEPIFTSPGRSERA